MRISDVFRCGALVAALVCLLALARGSFDTGERTVPQAAGDDQEVLQDAQAPLEIVAPAPNPQPIADLLQVDVPTVKTVLASWGPGRFDVALDENGKAFRPDGRRAGSLIPAASGFAGVALRTGTGFGSVPYWNPQRCGHRDSGDGNEFRRAPRRAPCRETASDGHERSIIPG